MTTVDRLTELRRQRDLLKQHLAWLEREIATTETSAGLPDSPPISSMPGPVRGVSGSRAPAMEDQPVVAAANRDVDEPGAAADAILDEYRTPSVLLRRDVRRGCFMYFAAALAAFAAAIVGLYFALKH